MKANQNNRWIVIVLGALIVAAGVLWVLNQPKTPVVSGEIQVIRGEETIKAFTLEEIRAMQSVSVEKEIVSSSHANDQGTFTGVPLRALLDEADPSWRGNAVQIAARAEDGFVVAYTADEVAKDDSFLVVYEKNGQQLAAKKDGGTGPLRLIIQHDDFGNRSVKYLAQIEVR